VDLSHLLHERREWILTRAAGTHPPGRRQAERVLEEARFVAHLYGLRVLREKSRPVLDGVAELVRRLIL
jgi:hypothetical protein